MTAFTSDLASTHNPATGTAPPATWGDLVRDNFVALGEAWTAFTPTWSGTLGNGTLSGAKRKIGRTVDYRISLVWGSSTSHPAAGQTFTLPDVPIAAMDAEYFPVGIGMAVDAGVGGHACTVRMSATSQLAVLHRNADNVTVTQAAPFTWATGDKALLAGTYEAAA